MFKQFLAIREREDGSSLLSQFGEPIQVGPNHWVFPSATFKEGNMPKSGYDMWGNRNTPDFKTMFHGMKLEGLYSIICDWDRPENGLRASGEKEAGHRYNKEARGVYMHDRRSFDSIYSYTRWGVPFGPDGVYVKCYLELEVDRNLRVPY